MKKTSLLLLLLLSMFKPFAQTITLNFEAKNANTQNSIVLDSVNVLNKTLGCDTTIYGSAPTLTIPMLSGIDDLHGLAFDVSPNQPNPFNGLTTLNIQLPAKGQLKLQLVDNMGKQLITNKSELGAGIYTFQLKVGEPGLVFLKVHYGNEIRSVKLVNTSTEGGTNSIGLIESNSHFTKYAYAQSGSGFIYQLGNELIITARAKGYEYNSTKDSPIGNKTYLFNMLPCLTTYQVTNITVNSAQCWGKLNDFFALSQGFCWDTITNPLISTSPFIPAYGSPIFKSVITELKPGQLYYFRAYAYDNEDTLYGDVLTFTTLIPSLTTYKVTDIMANSAQYWGKLNFIALSKGFCWDTIANPLIHKSPFIPANGSPIFKSDISGLKPGQLYYFRAYAIDNQDTLYGDVIAFTTLFSSNCGSFIINHQTGEVAPQTKTVTYETVTKLAGEPNKCWITSNLGSDHEASSPFDDSEASAGWYWKFNRKRGYNHNGSIVTPAWTYYWTEENCDWQISNDPCSLEMGAEWRIPTMTEWNNLDNVGNWNNTGKPWTSGLKLHKAGRIYYDNGSLNERSVIGYYWSSTTYWEPWNPKGVAMNIYSSSSAINYYDRAFGFSVRCLKNVSGEASVTTTETIAATNTTAISGGIVNWDAGNEVTERGVCWSTNTNPTVALSTKTFDGSGVGNFTSLITGLTPNTPYFVRAYATNSIGTSYGQEFSFVIQTCGAQLSINHLAGTTAPVNKITNYGTLTDIPGEPEKCWISKNLGANHQAASLDDSTETAAGWYWQFNCKQGFKHDGTVATPAWKINWIYEQTDWQADNDPCELELGNGWRIPTKTEWENVHGISNWNNWNGPWNSNLKLHAAGFIHSISGKLISRGVSGYYWSSTQSSPSVGWNLKSNIDSCNINYSNKSNGFPVRCISSGIWTTSLPMVTTTLASAITNNEATFGGTVTGDGGAMVTSRGMCWSTTPHPTTALSTKTTDGSGIGSFVSHISGLTANTKYFVRAYATNSAGTNYGEELNFIAHICNSVITIHHTAGVVAPVSKTVTYNTVNNIPGEPNKCWITQNLGSDHHANAINDTTEASAGWYWQFNRPQGYQHNGSTRTPNTTWITNIEENSDWIPSSDPCSIEMGNDWRLPTMAEWGNVKACGAWANYNDAWMSNLKLHASGYLEQTAGGLAYRGTYGYSNSNSQTDFISKFYFMSLYQTTCGILIEMKAAATTVRCIKDAASQIIITTNSITNLSLPTAISGGNITSDGGKEILSRGICWSIAPNPNLALSTQTLDGFGLGCFTSHLNGLTGNTRYYVRAFATTLSDTVYGNELTFTTNYCGSTITVNHVAGPVAPFTKTITYGTVDSIPGEPNKCWISQNLGADHQATAVNDASEASAGWYWKYNEKQGYNHNGITTTPNWIDFELIGDYTDWQPANDPCSAELSNGWRLPTKTEWMNVETGGGWNNWDGPWNSGLRLHAAGFIGGKVLAERGISGNYASSRQEGLDHYYYWKLSFNSSYSWVEKGLQKIGFTIRCIRDY